MKIKVYKILYYLNLLGILLLATPILGICYFIVGKGATVIGVQQFSEIIKTVFAFICFVFWIMNFIIWFKKDRNVGRFLLLFALPGLYTPFYYSIALKNNWI